MKHVSKRLFTLLLSLLLLTPAFASCGESAAGDTTETTDAPAVTETETETEAETREILSDGLPDADFGGYEFRILSFYVTDDDGAASVTAADYTGEPIHDSLRDSTISVEERFHCKIVPHLVVNAEAVVTDATTSINAGDNAFDILIGHDGMTFNMVKAGLFYNLYDVEPFNFEQPWWPERTVEALTVADRLYAASSYLSYIGLHWTRAAFINKDYAESIHVDIPYDLVREGKWTQDALLTMVSGTSQDLDGDGKMTIDDKIGYTTGSQTWYCMQESMEVSPYHRDENGGLYLDFDIEKVDSYASKWRSLMNSPDYLEGDDFSSTMFNLGNALFCYNQIGDAYDVFRTGDIRYGFLPSPKFDELQEEYVNCCTDRPWAMPKTFTAEDAARTGTIIEALSCQNYQNVLPVYFEESMKSRTADSPDDAEMLQLIADTRTISFPYTYGLPYNNIMADIGKGNTEVASYAKRSEKVAAKTLEKLVQKFDSMDTSK